VWRSTSEASGRRSWVAVDQVPELRELSISDDEIRLGAALTLTEVERQVGGEIPLLAEMLPQFASRLIRNGATLGGNLGTGSPIGDAPPALLALDAELVLASVRGSGRCRSRLLHRLPAERPRRRRADQGGRAAAAAGRR
jgi:xanthine dehydrogenase small subunit